ncbi:LytR/AlgR family response regulator transcription factor [candidate division KSB1 bacterium]
MTIKCMIIDDEILAQEVIEKYISSMPSLDLIKKCDDAIEAADYLLNNAVDLMFLDIKMPDLTGIEFLKTLKNPPKVIITTAYPEFALEGYEHSVIDYLVKPVSYERFLKAVNKVPVRDDVQVPPEKETEGNFIFIKENKVIHKIQYSDIHYIEGCGNFVKLVTGDRELVYLEKMMNLENNLPENQFVRVHKSYIISIRKIKQIEGNRITIDKKIIPVSKHYRINLDKVIIKYNI